MNVVAIDNVSPLRNWFDHGGVQYARFRPGYPVQLSEFLVSVAPDNNLALDIGCGNGQVALQLVSHFRTVVGVDPSTDQIANARLHGQIRYHCAAAEKLPLPDKRVSLIAAAQAAHWFDLPTFYKEVRRVAIQGGVLALITYGVLRLEPGLDELFRQFYWDDIGPYWPAERKLVDTGYTTIEFPFAEFSAPPLGIRLDWNLDELLGYISTWSAVRRAREAEQESVFLRFADNISEAWGDPGSRRPIVWPINMRVGKV